MVSVLLTQTQALVEKNLFILVYRRGIITLIRALVLPIICVSSRLHYVVVADGPTDLVWQMIVVSYISLLCLPPSKLVAHANIHLESDLFFADMAWETRTPSEPLIVTYSIIPVCDNESSLSTIIPKVMIFPL